jgi:hypothetical protein
MQFRWDSNPLICNVFIDDQKKSRFRGSWLISLASQILATPAAENTLSCYQLAAQRKRLQRSARIQDRKAD